MLVKTVNSKNLYSENCMNVCMLKVLTKDIVFQKLCVVFIHKIKMNYKNMHLFLPLYLQFLIFCLFHYSCLVL